MSVKEKFVVNSPLAKTTTTGQILCIVCNTTVKSAMVWTAHVNSRKHVENVANLKKTKQQPSKKISNETNNNAALRSADKRNRDADDADSPTTKKSRKGPETDLPSDFFDSSVKKLPISGAGEDSDDDDDDSMGASTSNNLESQATGATPWHAESEKKHKATQPEAPKPNSTEALPAGFFDDPKQDRKIRKAPDPSVALDEEYAKFQKEMQQVEQTQLETALEDDESELIEKEMADIDVQMMEWTRVNELEKKKEDMFTAAAAAQKARAEQMVTDDDEVDSDVDLDQIINWRTKNI